MSVNILDQNGNLKKIAHGFSESKFNTFRSDVISNIEMTDTASKDYAVGDFLIMASGQLAQVTSPIYQDMTISLSNVRLTTVEEMIAAKADPADIPDVSKYQKIFTGTMAEWNQLTTEQKTAYDLANITDDLGTEADIVDAITDGDMRAVTSNAVHDALESKISTSETTGLVKNDGSIDTKSYAEKVSSATNGNFASLDDEGNLTDSGHKHSDYLTQHQDISGKADKTAISSVEPSATAVSAHAVGSYFINASGQFVKATSAIAVGDTIIVKPAVGYNCEGTTVGDVLEAANAVDSVADGNLHPVTSNAVFDHFSNYIKIKENLRGDTDAGGKMNIPTSDLPLTSYPLLGYNTDGWCAIFYKYSNQWRARLFSVGANGVEILANQTNARLDIVYVNL